MTEPAHALDGEAGVNGVYDVIVLGAGPVVKTLRPAPGLLD